MTLHLRSEVGQQTLPVAFYEQYTGATALQYAGPRAQRVTRWNAAGWTTWWKFLARFAAGRPVVAAVPPMEGGAVPEELPTVHLIPTAVAVRAASPLSQGLALYLGAFQGEAAAFGSEGMAEPQTVDTGLEPLYRAVVAARFRRERRALLPVQVPALLKEDEPADVTPLLEAILPLLNGYPVVLGGEDDVITAALATVLRKQGHEVAVVDPLAGMERLVRAIGGLA
jgi:hypothetical protein